MNHRRLTLDFVLRQRPHTRSHDGTFHSERNDLDLRLDGKSLMDPARYDLVSVFCREWVRAEREKSLRRLLLMEPADLNANL